ncbi:MAG: radical SAM family heme chaperone HemW [Syntrophotaleaceae bacterium]
MNGNPSLEAQEPCRNGRPLPPAAISSLYIHVPFCLSKCPYCDFFSLAEHETELRRYPELLLRHLALAIDRGLLQNRLSTLFFGGGTPSLLTPEALAAIIAALSRAPGISADAEISLEANPGTVNLEKLQGFRSAGLNRLSIGIQSLNGTFLNRLGRRHTPEQAVTAFRDARRAGFANLSCDLMFGLPGQRRRQLLDELDAILALEPEHLSCYGLTVEEDTPFYHLHHRGGLPLPDEEESRELYLAIHDRLVAAGYRHYEISNYALPGHECRHNLVYWRRGAYLGIGAGAHSFDAERWGQRWAAPPDLNEYSLRLDRGEDPAEKLEDFDRQGAMAETIYLGLRTSEGIGEADFMRQFGQGVASAFPEAVARCGSHLVFLDGRWCLDLAGWLIYDHLIEAFL